MRRLSLVVVAAIIASLWIPLPPRKHIKCSPYHRVHRVVKRWS